MKTSDYLTPEEIETIRGGGIVKVTALEGLDGDDLKTAKERNKAIRAENRVRGKINHKATAKERRKKYWSDALKDFVGQDTETFGKHHEADCSFGGIKISGGRVQKGLTSYPLTECAVDMIDGGKPARMTATRIGAGAILAGPVGAIIGGMAKKDRSKTFIVVAHAGGGSLKEEVHRKDRAKAMAFIRSFEMAQNAAIEQH